MISFLKNKVLKFFFNKKSIKYSFIFFLFISIGFLLGNHFSFEGKKGFNWEGAKTFNTYIKKKYYVQKTVNPLDLNSKNIELKDRKIPKDADLKGFWSPPFDWPVIAVHSILLPDETVMTFGSYGIKEKEEGKNISQNKKLKLTDNFELERDKGTKQWKHHDVLSGVDFVIWDPKKGIDKSSQKVFHRPIVLDAFCSVVRVFDNENVFILGGNLEPKHGAPDTQNATTFYNIKTQKFTKGRNLNYDRWYGSIVRTAENSFIMVGGAKILHHKELTQDRISHIPEILTSNKDGTLSWKILKEGASEELLGGMKGEEWSYPKFFLSSDGNPFGISYNKLWVMDKENNYKILKVGEIPLATGGISEKIIHQNPNDEKDYKELSALTISSPVGDKGSAVMIDKDKILIIGGQQKETGYAASNKTIIIDISDSFNPKIINKKSMSYPRAFADATILPTGDVFVNGGTAVYQSADDDTYFSNFTPEIYQSNDDIWKKMSKSNFRRNYHSTSLLLPDGRIFVAGGDVWNAQLFYPPYLFSKDSKGKTVLAKRPKIEELKKVISKRKKQIMKVDDSSEIEKISLISTGSTTHAQASELKHLSLNFKKINKNQIEFDIPEDKNTLTDGTYLIFTISNSGIPSKGKITYIK
ncbi:DUF1929 domain-containing protein [Pelagibacterales bacterium SAG-MED20]|nr:DUF1929 domain-containing protein [Pelagibacterales bacterium SAG-MED20]